MLAEATTVSCCSYKSPIILAHNISCSVVLAHLISATIGLIPMKHRIRCIGLVGACHWNFAVVSFPSNWTVALTISNLADWFTKIEARIIMITDLADCSLFAVGSAVSIRTSTVAIPIASGWNASILANLTIRASIALYRHKQLTILTTEALWTQAEAVSSIPLNGSSIEADLMVWSHQTRLGVLTIISGKANRTEALTITYITDWLSSVLALQSSKTVLTNVYSLLAVITHEAFFALAAAASCCSYHYTTILAHLSMGSIFAGIVNLAVDTTVAIVTCANALTSSS